MTILKSLIRTYFLECAIDSFYSGFKGFFLNGAEKGELIDYRSLTEGMFISRIVEHLGTCVFVHEHCTITTIEDTWTGFVCRALIHESDTSDPHFKRQRWDENEENWVNYHEAEFYL